MITALKNREKFYPDFTNFIRVFILFNLILLFPLVASSQSDNELKVSKRIELSKTLTEISGITFIGNTVYALNDSGNDNVIYELDSESFKIKEQFDIKGAKNIDWEELSSFNNEIYIGNFGNNSGKRKDLSVFTLRESNLNAKNQKTEVLPFKYLEQASFNSIPYHHKWDCEAMVVNKAGIWLLSKDWDNRTCRLYNLNDRDSTGAVKPRDNFNPGFLVTGAYFVEDADRLFLCGYENNSTYLLVLETTADLSFSGRWTKYSIPELERRQVESIFVRDNVIYLASESTKVKQSIYMIDIPEFMIYE